MSFEVESEDVIRLILQFLKENNLTKTLRTLQAESSVCLNTIDNLDNLMSDINHGRWEAVMPQVSSLSLPLAKLVAVYEQLVLELLEMRELDVAREILRTADPFLQMKKEEPDRYLRLEHWLQKGAMIDPRDLYPAGSSKEKRRAEIANMLIPEVSVVSPSRLLALVNQALKWQQVQGLLPRGQKFDLFRGGARASKKDLEEKPPRKIAGQIKFGTQSHPEVARFSPDGQFLASGSVDGFAEQQTGEPGAACGNGAPAAVAPRVNSAGVSPPTLPGFKNGEKDVGAGDDRNEQSSASEHSRSSAKASAGAAAGGTRSSAHDERDAHFSDEELEALCSRHEEEMRQREGGGVRKKQHKGKGKAKKDSSSGCDAAPGAASEATSTSGRKSPAVLKAVDKLIKVNPSSYEGLAAYTMQWMLKQRQVGGYSACTQRPKMVAALKAEDQRQGRETPFWDDLQGFMDGEGDVKNKADAAPAIPDGLIVAVRNAAARNVKRTPGKDIQWGNKSYKLSDVYAVIDKEDAENAPGGSSGGNGVGAGVASRKGKHCLMRFMCLLLGNDKHRNAFMESKQQANRAQLDTKAIGSSSPFWTDIGNDYRDPGLEIPRVFQHPMINDCDPMVLQQPDISDAKIMAMYTEAKKNWNPCWGNYKGEFGNHAEWSDFCENNKDIYIMGAAVEKFPDLHGMMSNLLPEGVQREDAGTGRGDGVEVVGAPSGAEQRAGAKRSAAAVYHESQADKGAEMKKVRQGGGTKAGKVIESAVEKAMSKVVAPAMAERRSPEEIAEAISRARTEEADADVAELKLKDKHRVTYRTLRADIKALEDQGEDKDEFEYEMLCNDMKELKEAMRKKRKS